jgi:hypothetical protein
MGRLNTTNGQAPRRAWRQLIVFAALAVTGCGSAAAPGEPPPTGAPADAATSPSSAEPGPSREQHTAESPTATAPSPNAESNLVDDDGKTLWESPTHDRPLSLAYLPPGCQIILSLRPQALAGDAQGEKIIDWVTKYMPDEAHYLAGLLPRVPGLTQCLVGAQIRKGHWEFSVVVHIGGGDTAAEYLALAFPNATNKSYQGKVYWLVNDRAYYLPAGADAKLLVISSEDEIADIIDFAGNPPPLRRDMERLIQFTDASRQATVLFAPSFLFGEGESIFSGEAARLRDPLFWFLGDDLSAAAISANWDENFFIEFSAVPTLDGPTNKIANQLAQRLAKSPDRVAAYDAALSPSEYGKAIIERFPGMVRALATYTRHRADRDHVVLRCYLPAAAGQNLLMGAELTLAESQLGSKPQSSMTAETGSAKSVRERLQRHTSLRFTKDTLEAALKMLADDVGVEIIIRGADLQLDGITKNQSFGIDLADKPADEILTQILRLANPDKTASGPADPMQKLVYVVEPKSPGGPDVVFVTTRAAAKKLGETLPAVFTAK